MVQIGQDKVLFTPAKIVVDHNTGKYYKTAIYYAIGHFSKFLPPGSVRIAT